MEKSRVIFQFPDEAGILAIERMGLFGKNIYFTIGNHSDDILTDVISTIEGTSNSC